PGREALRTEGLDVDEPDDVRPDAGARGPQVVEEGPGVLRTAVLQRQVEAAQAGQLLDVGGLEPRRARPAQDEDLRGLLEVVEQVGLDGAVVRDAKGRRR